MRSECQEKMGAKLIPVERYCGKCWKPLQPEEDQCSKCGSFSVAEPFPIKFNENGTFECKVKFISRSKISKNGKEAKEHLRIVKATNQKIHHVIEKDSEGNWQTLHDECVPLPKKKKHQNKANDK